MNRMDNIISNFSACIIQGFNVRHNYPWQEHKTKLEYTLWCVKKGKIIIDINNNRYVAQQHDAVLFYPGNEYHATTDKDGCDFVVVHFKLEMGNGMDLFLGNNLAGIATNINEQSQLFCERFMDRHPLALRTSFEQYIVFINYIYEVIKSQQSKSAILFHTCTDNVNKSVIQEAIDYISLNYNNVTVQQTAKHVHLNEKRFISNFKNVVGMSPGHYISRCKMFKAAEMLSTTNIKLTEIAYSLGFADQYSFSKAFKRTFGESPSLFRKNSII